MKKISVILFCLCSSVYLKEVGTGTGVDGNLRVCIVEGKGNYKRGAKFCPVIEEQKSGVECVLGTDRLDCLRRISKGTVDFGVFSPEDLIAAQWANIKVLVTHELRQRPKPYERSVVAIVNRRILPENPGTLDAVLRNTSLCHPGNGVDDLRPLSDTLAGYLESLVVTRSCDPELSLMENKIKVISEFFLKACKAGPWVPEPDRDAELKRKYPSLCAACHSRACSAGDRYWGSGGALACLTAGAGDVMWGEYTDVQAYFGLNKPMARPGEFPSSDNFVFLCRDGTSQTIRNNSEPCVWLNRPWPVIVAKEKSSALVSTIVESLTGDTKLDGHWHEALAALLELRATPTPLQPPTDPLDYLGSAHGFREAYSQAGCHPPRHITLCTTSLLETNKCEWMSEAASVYGVTPPVQCSRQNSIEDCIREVRDKGSDVAVITGDVLLTATRDYHLEPILFETTPIVEQLNTVVAYVRKSDNLSKMDDLRGKRAAFPRFDGVAWHSVLRYLKQKENKSCRATVDYFSEVCAPGAEKYNLTKDNIDKFTKGCQVENGVVTSGEISSLRSLVEGKTDVAFISMKTVKMYQNHQILEPWANTNLEIVPICPETNAKYCYISWANIGHVMTAKNLTSMRRNEITVVFAKLDQLFGKHQPFHSPMFAMYGMYNHQADIIFHNNTKNLVTEHILRMHPYDKMAFNFERSLNDTTDSCQNSDYNENSAYKMAPSILTLLCLVISLTR